MQPAVFSVRRAAGAVPALLCWAMLPFLAVADDPAPKSGSLATTSRAMRAHAGSIRLSEPAGVVPLGAGPLLRYDDRARDIADATVWAWGGLGRPAAVVKIEHRPARPPEQRWLCALASLSPHPITAEGAGGRRWAASKPGLSLSPIDGAAPPADSEATRLRQMKQLAQRFEAYEFSGRHGRLQLRLLARPLHRYSDPAAGVRDGAVFGFAYGTNPDILLAIESHARDGSPPAWRYGVAGLGAGKMFVKLDGREVWGRPGTGIPARGEAYTNWFEGDAEPEGGRAAGRP